ncbi:outer membrane protein assembly factor BamA [Bacteroidales bacterium OttesenSCG-928-K03]|nr:outer membrane protein assembly factor BamA [Odoribacter sp. OttesenSCG-928-L07]MDL2239022.1 outer membrane protein assembly factor BamA [Bacteroidales bacterium OttesenSCG-928-L14]MDL2241062.1 outer membrane protein assembly factor BamA [Bacteroidales bacterium OttesenSCG-928-K22]MDL2242140.1 outer membrane protein assembly factor BamA [Bacteroidales bacterium OttesenSCG-928-K03]
MKNRLLLLLILITTLTSTKLFSQVTFSGELDNINYNRPKEYTIGGISISGVQYLDQNVLRMISGLRVGDKITVPGEEISNAIKNLWKQGLFSDVSITATSIVDDQIFLNIYLEEKPRLSKFAFKGISKSDADNLRDEMKIVRGDVVNDNLLMKSNNTISSYYSKKGFYNVNVDIQQERDTAEINSLILTFVIDKNKKVRINKINVSGNEFLDETQVKMSFKETKQKGSFTTLSFLDTLFISTVKKAATFDYGEIVYNVGKYTMDNTNIRLFKSSKFIEDRWEEDKVRLIDKYNSLGFRDFKILNDTLYFTEDRQGLILDLDVSEGNRYYFRNITWVGNTKYTADELNSILKIKKGDVYNKKELEANLNFNLTGMDVSSLYMDDGYLFFRVNPMEVLVENDSIDIVIQIMEGNQANINKVKLYGNTKTNDFVAMREIRTRPGDLFSRSNIIRSQRELSSLGYFNPETIVPDVQQNPMDGTVDLIYTVEETSSDQLELSLGWGYGRLIGTIGVKFSNFALSNMFKKEAWRPVPVGDGQTLSFRFQTYGKQYINLSASFTEPWLGRKKPNAFSTTYYYSHYAPYNVTKTSDEYGKMDQHAVIFGLGRRLSWPDDFFTLYQSISLINYSLVNYNGFGNGMTDGHFFNYTYGITLARNSTDQPYYPRRGSDISLSVKLSPPYSLFSQKTAEDYASMNVSDRYKWVEYHKWDFRAAYYQKLIGDLVVMVRLRYGFLGSYNKDLGITPFERYYMGGDGLTGNYFNDGRELIGFRGYTSESMSPDLGATIYNKNTIELRYPLSLNPNATIFALLFLETGSSWANFKEFKPFDTYRSAGAGVRVFMPMFGLLGLDWGYGFDPIPGNSGASGSQFHFSINGSID